MDFSSSVYEASVNPGRRRDQHQRPGGGERRRLVPQQTGVGVLASATTGRRPATNYIAWNGSTLTVMEWQWETSGLTEKNGR